MDGGYADNFSKIALAATSAQLAKAFFVKDLGIGEDLTFNFMGWNYDELSIVCQIKKDLMKIPADERLSRCTEVCATLRQVWGVTGITMVAEGYCSLDPAATKNAELSKIFAEPDSPVEECITITHAEILKDFVAVNLIALPYIYDVGRNVNWLEMLVYPTKAMSILRNYRYPKMMQEVLSAEIAEEAAPELFDEAREHIMRTGFYIQEFF